MIFIRRTSSLAELLLEWDNTMAKNKKIRYVKFSFMIKTEITEDKENFTIHIPKILTELVSKKWKRIELKGGGL